jgi:hypothetical protein
MPQPTETDQFGAMQPAPLGTPHGYERTASLQGNKRLFGGPATERIAGEVHQVLTSRPERTLSGIDDKAPRAKYAAGESSEDAIAMRSITEGIAISFGGDGKVADHGLFNTPSFVSNPVCFGVAKATRREIAERRSSVSLH